MKGKKTTRGFPVSVEMLKHICGELEQDNRAIDRVIKMLNSQKSTNEGRMERIYRDIREVEKQ